MASIILLYVPPFIKGGSPAYYVMLEGQGLNNPFPIALSAIQQFNVYRAAGHTLLSDPVWRQGEIFRYFNEKAAAEQQPATFSAIHSWR